MWLRQFAQSISAVSEAQFTYTGRRTFVKSVAVMTSQESVILQKINELVQKHKLLSDHYDISKKVVDFEHPEDLRKLLPLTIDRKGVSNDELERIRYEKAI